ncbi:MAG: hypothetical protein ACTSV2_06630 [Candidatus Thorarchaeota archaeon]
MSRGRGGIGRRGGGRGIGRGRPIRPIFRGRGYRRRRPCCCGSCCTCIICFVVLIVIFGIGIIAWLLP